MAIPKLQRALQIRTQGGIDVLKVEQDVPVPELAEGEVLIRTEWAGCNFIDTYQRSGVYPLAKLPAILGNECGGVVAALGPGVSPAEAGFDVGDRVAAYLALTGFSEYARASAVRTIKLPDEITTKQAATVTLQGLTALTFVTEAHPVQKDEWVLVHAAAGGLGSLLCQICAHKGAHVIGTVSTEEKARIAKANGAEHVVLYKDVAFDAVARQVVALTPGGEGVHAIFDGVGKDTFDANFTAVRRKGSIVSIGNASGAVPPFPPLKLGPKCIKLSRPILGGYVTTRSEFAGYATALFDLVSQGHLRLALWKEDGYPFTTEGLQQAHTDISGRGTTGKLIVQVAA